MDEADAFYSIKLTENKLLNLAENSGTSLEKSIELQGNKKHKFKDNIELSYLEKSYFAFPYTPFTAKCENIKVFKGSKFLFRNRACGKGYFKAMSR